MYTDKLIVFDLFGVVFTKGLASSIDHLKGVLNRPEGEISVVYRKWEKEFDLGLINENQFWERVNKELSTNISPKILSNIVVSSYRLKEDTLKLANYLKRDFPIIVYSNYRREWFDRLDRKYRISKVFDEVYISSDTKKRKPHGTVFDFIKKEHNVPSKNIVLIDDDSKNITGITNWGGYGLKFDNVFETEIQIRNLFSNQYPRYNEYYAGVLLVSKQGGLILQRRDEGYHIANPGKLSVFGGRKEGRESIIECALRELQEETSIAATEDDLSFIGEFSCPIERNDWMHCTYYMMTGIDVNQVNLNEGQDIEIWKPDEALDRRDITPVPRLIISKLIEEKRL